jgi:hypothetical protein
MLLGSSGVVKRVKSPLKNVCENANSLTLKVVHLWGWHICKGVEDLVIGFGLWWILVSNSALIQSVFVKNSVGMDSPLNKLSIESKII